MSFGTCLCILLAQVAGPAPGDILVTNFGGNSVSWFEGETGTYVGDLVPEGSGGLDRPVGIGIGSDGALYVSSAGTNQVLRYDAHTGAFRDVFAQHELLTIPSLLTFGPNADLYVGTFQGGRVLTFDGATGEFLGVAARGLVSPIGLAFDDSNQLYVASAGQNRVARFNSSGTWIDDVVSDSTLAFPTGLMFASDGSLLVSSLRSGRVLRFEAETGEALGLLGSLPDDAGPGGLTADAEGRIVIADLNQNRLYRIDAVGEVAQILSTDGMQTPEGIAIVPGS